MWLPVDVFFEHTGRSFQRYLPSNKNHTPCSRAPSVDMSMVHGAWLLVQVVMRPRSRTSWFRLNAQNLHPGDSRRQFKVDCHETDTLVFPTTTATGRHLLFLELRLWCGVISENIGSASLGQSAASKLSGRKIRFFNPTL